MMIPFEAIKRGGGGWSGGGTFCSFSTSLDTDVLATRMTKMTFTDGLPSQNLGNLGLLLKIGCFLMNRIPASQDFKSSPRFTVGLAQMEITCPAFLPALLSGGPARPMPLFPQGQISLLWEAFQIPWSWFHSAPTFLIVLLTLGSNDLFQVCFCHLIRSLWGSYYVSPYLAFKDWRNFKHLSPFIHMYSLLSQAPG